MNIYVGNLPRKTSETELREAFVPFGEVTSASIIMDKMSGESRGFGFVEMPNKSEALAAIQAMNGKDFDGRTLTVNEARPKEDRGGGFRGGSGGRGGPGGPGGGQRNGNFQRDRNRRQRGGGKRY
jgi:RNA recognition motif-containing protein